LNIELPLRNVSGLHNPVPWVDTGSILYSVYFSTLEWQTNQESVFDWWLHEQVVKRVRRRQVDRPQSEILEHASLFLSFLDVISQDDYPVLCIDIVIYALANIC
jgi:hypothetical protein